MDGVRMRLIIVSDSHGNSKILNEIASRYIGKVDAFVHCGDSELDSSNSIWNTMDTVSGNCDFDWNIPDIYVNNQIEYPYLVVHGHQHGVKYSLEQLKLEAINQNVNFIFYGHTHIMKFDKEDGIFIINPGSISQPRGQLKEKTYCLLKVTEDKVSIQVFNDTHSELQAWNETWSRQK